MSMVSVFAAAITPAMASTAVAQGFRLMGLGLALVFMALILVYGLIKLMTVLFKEKPKEK